MPHDPRGRTKALVVASFALVAIACSGASGQDLGLAEGGAGDGSAQGGGDGGDAGSDARVEGGPLTCNVAGGPFPTLNNGCTGNDACVVAIHQIDCCGSNIALGLNHAVLNTFQRNEADWEASCPKCDCALKPLLAEDGKSGQQADVRVMCDFTTGTGKCKTYFP
jgi:hypothetical protein